MLKENETLELKKTLTQLKEGVISLSAMLNKQHKGELYFGINDEGKVCGVEIGKKTISDIAHEIKTNLKPLPIILEINELKENEKDIIKIYVEGNDAPYSAYGRYYFRINDSDTMMTENILQNLFENKMDDYSKWEKTETNYTIDDIDEDLLINYMREANEKGRINYLYKNAKETLKKLELLTENDKLNMAGYYLFGNNRPLTIKLANYPTDSRTEFGEIKEFKGNIFECIKEAIAYIQNHISYKSEIIGIQRVETPEIPIRAIREIVINSFAHCKYSIKGDFNQYIIYKSSVVIYNPGSIYHNVDPIKFASAEVGSKIRNLSIASVLYKCGYIDSFGTGFDRTFTLCLQNRVKYQYFYDEFGFKFIFKREKNFLNDKKNDKINDKISAEILKCIENNKYITIPEIALKIEKSEQTVHRRLNKMVLNNKVQRIGSRKTGYWSVL